MKSFKTISKNISISPRKMMVVAGVIKKKEVSSSLENLKLSINNSKSVRIMYKILKSSYKQFLDYNKNEENFSQKKVFIDSINVDKGITRKKIFFRAKGRADTIKNRKSHLTVSFIVK